MATTNLKKQFAGKVAVVTGGTQGLGQAIAELLAERGAAGLVLVGRNARRGKEIAAGFTEKGCKARYVQADLGNMALRRLRKRPPRAPRSSMCIREPG